MKIKRILELGTSFTLALSSILTISIPVALATSYNCTWTGLGGDNKFSTASNWSNCNGAEPQPGDDDTLIFNKDDVVAGVLDNDLAPGASFSSIIIDGSGVDGFTFTGNSITFVDSGGSITDNSSTAGSFDVFDLPINMSVNHVISVSNANVEVTLGSSTSALSGTGNISKAGAGTLVMSGDNTSWTGSLTAASGSVWATSPNAFGSSLTDAIFNNGSDFVIFSCSDFTFNGNVTLNDSSSITTGDYPNPKLYGAVGCAGGGGTADENYGYAPEDSSSLTLAGDINLGSDITFAGIAGTTNITGDLLGSHSITMLPGYSGKLVINSSNNASNTPNGTYTSGLFSKTISDSSSNTVEIFKNNSISIDGSRGATTVHSGGTLNGTGTVGVLDVETGGNVGPGHSPGCLTTGNLTLNGAYQAQLGGTAACSGYDQLIVTGSVNLTGATLDTTLYNGFVPAGGQSYTIVNNDGVDAVVGTFSGISEGSAFTASGVTYKITYQGGSGNDVVLTVQSVDPSKLPGQPNTGFRLLTSSPLLTLMVSVFSALGLVTISRRFNTNK